MFAHISIYMKVNKNRRPFLHIRKNWRSNIGNSILQRSIYICNVRIEIDFCLSFEFFYARGNVLKFCKMSCQKFEICNDKYKVCLTIFDEKSMKIHKVFRHRIKRYEVLPFLRRTANYFEKYLIFARQWDKITDNLQKKFHFLNFRQKLSKIDQKLNFWG